MAAIFSSIIQDITYSKNPQNCCNVDIFLKTFILFYKSLPFYMPVIFLRLLSWLQHSNDNLGHYESVASRNDQNSPSDDWSAERETE